MIVKMDNQPMGRANHVRVDDQPMRSPILPPELLAELRDQGAEVARAIAEAVRREVGEYESFASPEAFSAVVADTRRHLDLLGRCASTGRMPDSTEIDFVLDLARQRAVA